MSWFKRDRKQAGPPEPPSAVLGPLEIRRPTARASSEAADRGAAFMAITNTGPEADRLVGARCPVAAQAELHAIKVVGPDIQMRPMAAGLAFPPGDSRELKPRGYHVLLTGLGAPLAPGSRLALTLCFEKAGEVEVSCLVEAPGPVGNAALHIAGD